MSIDASINMNLTDSLGVKTRVPHMTDDTIEVVAAIDRLTLAVQKLIEVTAAGVLTSGDKRLTSEAIDILAGLAELESSAPPLPTTDWWGR